MQSIYSSRQFDMVPDNIISSTRQRGVCLGRGRRELIGWFPIGAPLHFTAYLLYPSYLLDMLDLAARFQQAHQEGSLVFYESEAHTRPSHGVEVTEVLSSLELAGAA